MSHPIERILNHINGASFISIDTMTEVKVNKTMAREGDRKTPNPHFGRIMKKTVGANVMVFTNKNKNGYEAMVKRRLAKEGKDPSEFELQPRTWGVRISNTPFVEHKGELYLEVIHMTTGDSKLLLDGVEIKRSEIIGMPVESDAEQGGLDDKVIIRTINFKNIRRIVTDGQVHEL